ncbi:MAG: radical SAM protein [Clostridia bacterium]|nr:radical SAM protein [Clostridia bacterium]
MLHTWTELTNKLISAAKEKRLPISGAFELTPRCNLKCKMCYVCQPVNDKQTMANERSAEEWIRLAKEMRDAGVLFLLLTGGEVFLREDFKEIYEQISEMGFIIQIYTNATMITPEIAKWLGKRPPSKVSVTLYGSTPEMYEKVCGFADGYERTVRGIDLLIAEGIVVEVKTTVVRGNKDEFNRIAAFAEKRNIKFGVVNYISPRREGCCSDPEGERLSPEELAEYEMSITEYNKRKHGEITLDPATYDNLDDYEQSGKSNGELLAPSSEKEDPFRCSAGKCGFWISWNGRMLACGIMNKPETYPLQTGFLQAWEGLKKLCSVIPNCDPCSECSVKEYCSRCPARLLTETGCYDKPAPYLCETAHKRMEVVTRKNIINL